MRVFQKLIFIFFLFSFNVNNLAAVNDEWNYVSRFEIFDGRNAISTGEVNYIVQDKFGYLWLAGENGVVRYDGYKNQSFPIDSSISKPISRMVTDEKGNLWLTTKSKRLFYFSYKENRFVELNIKNSDGLSIISENKNELKLISDVGDVFTVDNSRNITKLFSNRSFKAKDYDINDAVSIDAGLVVATSNGVLLVDFKKQNISQLKIEGSFNSIEKWHGRVLIGSSTGLYIYNHELQAIEKISGANEELANCIIYTILNEGNENIWLGTYEDGIIILDKEFDIVERILKGSSELSLMQNDTAKAIFQDDFGLIWIATDTEIAQFNPQHRYWNHTRELAIKSDANKSIAGISESSNGLLFIGSHSDGISVYSNNAPDNTGKPIRVIDSYTIKDEKFPLHSIYAIYAHSDGAIWVGHAEGIVRINPESWEVERYEVSVEPESHAVSVETKSYSVTEIQEAGDNTWVGTYKHGLIQLNEDKTKIYKLESQTSSLSNSNSIYRIYVSKSGKIWVTTTGGVFVYDSVKDSFIEFSDLVAIDSRLHGVSYSIVSETEPGVYWIGTHGYGIIIYDEVKGSVEYISEKKGLMNGSVNGIICDGNYCWVSTNDGLYVFNSRTYAVRKFDYYDGLQNNEFNGKSFHQLEDGRLIFGGINGFNIFRPEIINQKKNNARPIVTLFDKDNDFIGTMGSEPETSSVFDVHYYQLPVTFEVKSIHFADTDSNYSRFRFANESSNWTESGELSTIRYSQLPFGASQFVAQSRTSHNDWSLNQVEFKINFIPPFWKTRWAYSIYLLFFFVSLFFIYRWRINIIKKRAMKLEKTVLERTNELELKQRTIQEQYQQLKKLSEEKTIFFENISHEFRTPLTLILGPVKRLLKQTNEKATTEQLSVINRNATRLLNLIEQLLDISRLNAGLKKNQPTSIQLASFIDEILEDFRVTAIEMDITLENIVPSDMCILFDPESLQRILLNLTSNAIKYNVKGGNVRFSSEVGDRVTLMITDTGIGIEKDKLDSIFERFSRMENNLTIAGTGIGLALVKELLELNGTSIDVESQLNEGTQFSISFPFSDRKASDIELVKPCELIDNSQPPIIQLDSNKHTIADSKTQVLVFDDDSVLSAYSLLSASNGKQALSLAIEQVPDMIVTDAMMPVMDGFELVRQIRENPITNHIPVLILTARGSKYSRLEGLMTGVDDYLTKPFDELELKQRVENLISSRRLLREKFSINERAVLNIDSAPSAEEKFLNNMEQTLATFYSHSEFSLSRFASELAMSERQLQRKLKAITGISPTEAIKKYRLERAKVLLLNGESVSNVCYTVGFNSLPHFSREFKEMYQVSPSNVGQLKE